MHIASLAGQSEVVKLLLAAKERFAFETGSARFFQLFRGTLHPLRLDLSFLPRVPYLTIWLNIENLSHPE